MGRMIRKQVYIERDQDEFLKRSARELGITEADVIRRAIGQASAARLPGRRDRQAWAEELAFLRRRAQEIPATGGRRDWTREDLYAGRLDRLSR